ncbi:MFS transporter [Alteribacillus iranensis]|uniref:MFS transporter, FSR family, fosmidomycin resistance protein n=1 Tax=Alteribacillus iranensis TaxID=930128 RepID=A0A1I2BAM4_9BACI|nr:MFS transporter [Alteribacillus iranensis]SFE53146.1 MFS transporter, FSR family, fosmidomycin resistance protein [Alteribacillus iranensis]
MKRTSINLLSAGHFTVDFYQGVVPALIPFFIEQHQFTYAAAAGLIFATNITSSIVQPLFGQFSDKYPAPWLMPLGVLLAGGGLALTGLFEGYWMILLLTALSGIGIAAYHPEAARGVNRAAGDKKSLGMSIFSVGGNAGFAVGPIAATASLAMFGLPGTLLLIIPAAVVTVLLITQLFRFSATAGSAKKQVAVTEAEPQKNEWGAFSRLTVLLICRSILFYGLNTFLPLYWIHVLMQSKVAGGSALTVLLLSGAAGTLLGGYLADKLGRRRVVSTSFVFIVPVLLVFLMLENVLAATLLLIPIGVLLFAPTSVMVVMGQSYLPNRIGMASGVTLGIAISAGGVMAPALGWLADHNGLPLMMLTLTTLPILAAILSLTLPKKEQM